MPTLPNKSLPNKDSPGGLCANLAKWSNLGKIQIISHASRQLKENDKNYTRFLLETATAAWGMDNFNEYLKGLKFTIYRDLTIETTLGTTQLKYIISKTSPSSPLHCSNSQGKTPNINPDPSPKQL